MKKPLRILITLLICLIASESYSQKLNKLYYGIATDSAKMNHYLSFENDTLVKIRSIHRHMSPPQELNFTYTSQNGIITMNQIETDSLRYIVNNELKLEIDRKALIDRTNKVVYILNKDYEKLNFTTYIIDGEEYRQKNTVSNSYGLVEKTPRRNRKLKRKVKEIEKKIEEYKIEIIKGIDAYDTYGYEYIFGIIKLSVK